MPQRIYRVVAGIIHDGERILLVKQKGANDAAPSWALPGGIGEDSELLSDALIREIKEEAGLTIETIGKLAYATQLDDQVSDSQSLAFVFTVERWTGHPTTNDPDKLVSELGFFSLEEAADKLLSLPWPHMSQPAIAYLRGQVPAGAVWLYRQIENGQAQLASRL